MRNLYQKIMNSNYTIIAVLVIFLTLLFGTIYRDGVRNMGSSQLNSGPDTYNKKQSGNFKVLYQSDLRTHDLVHIITKLKDIKTNECFTIIDGRYGGEKQALLTKCPKEE